MTNSQKKIAQEFETPSKGSWYSTFYSKNNWLPIWGGMLLFILLIGSGIFAISTRNNSSSNIPKPTIVNKDLPPLEHDTTAYNTIIFGAKIKNEAVIQAVNDTGTNYTTVTKISSNSKSSIPLNNGNTIIYLAGLNDKDEASHIEAKIINDHNNPLGSVSKIYSATDGYKIDYLNISRNNEWIIWYETKPEEGKPDNHQSNYFRSFKANIKSLLSGTTDPINPILLKSEKSPQDEIIHLPSIVTNDGRVFFDGLRPVGYILFEGIVNENNDVVLPANSYSGQPILIQDDYLLYTSYNSALSPQVTGDGESARKAVINKNAIKIKRLSTNTTTTFVNGYDGQHYNHPVYASGTPGSDLEIAVEIYNVKDNKLVQKEIQIVKETNGSVAFTTILTNKGSEKYRLLASGKTENQEHSFFIGEETGITGNLGSGWFTGISSYQSTLKSLLVVRTDKNLVFNKITVKSPERSLTPSFEFIGILPNSPTQRLGINRNENIAEEYYAIARNIQQLHLDAFVPIEPKRQRTNFRSECESEWQAKGYPSYEACERCPIYIYSPTAQNVIVKPISALVKSSAIPPLVDNVWNVTANKTGTLTSSDGKTYSYIDFYFPRGSLETPSYGIVSNQLNLEKNILSYAQKAGLSDNEAYDLVQSIKPSLLNAPFIIISHLPDSEAYSLLNVEVTPKPNTQFTRVFYFKKVDNPYVALQKPHFTSIIREGLTVVSWGAVVD